MRYFIGDIAMCKDFLWEKPSEIRIHLCYIAPVQNFLATEMTKNMLRQNLLSWFCILSGMRRFVKRARMAQNNKPSTISIMAIIGYIFREI